MMDEVPSILYLAKNIRRLQLLFQLILSFLSTDKDSTKHMLLTRHNGRMGLEGDTDLMGFHPGSLKGTLFGLKHIGPGLDNRMGTHQRRMTGMDANTGSVRQP